MKRRNFLSGLLAAPLALKARLVGLFGQQPVRQLSPYQRRIVELLAQGKPMKEIAEILQPCSMRQWALRPGSMKQWAEKAIGRRGAWLN